MKRIIRSFAVHTASLWLIASYVGGVEYHNQLKFLITGSIALTIADTFLKPLINVLLLPFNLVTLGVFRWVSNVITLFIAAQAVSGFSIVSFHYQGLVTNWFIIPAVTLSIFWAYILVSFLLSVLTSALFWLSE